MKNPRKLVKKNRKLSNQNTNKSESEKVSQNTEAFSDTISKKVAVKDKPDVAATIVEPTTTTTTTTPQKFFWTESSPDPSDDDSSCSESDGFNFHNTTYKFREPDVGFAKYAQRMLEIGRGRYRGRRYHGPEDEQKTCIWSGGDSFSWTEKSSGISWIGVNGTESVCVVSSTEQDVLRWHPYGRHQLTLRHVHANAVSDMGVWADISTEYTEFRRRIAQSSKPEGPFAVVSVAPDSVVDDKYLEISHECQQQATRAINFLEAKLKDSSSFSPTETIEIAVRALKYLLGSKFNPKEIEAFGSEKFCVPMGPSKECLLKAAKNLDVMDLTTSVSSLNVSS